MKPEDLSQPYPETDPEPRAYTYHVSVDEVREMNVWLRQHCKDHHEGRVPYCGAIGGMLTMTFVSTGLGTITGVECNLCHANKKDKTEYMHCLTDFKDW